MPHLGIVCLQGLKPLSADAETLYTDNVHISVFIIPYGNCKYYSYFLFFTENPNPPSFSPRE